MTTAEMLYEEALKLPTEDRAALAQRLLDSTTHGRPLPEFSDAWWDAEIQRRDDAIESGAEVEVSWESVKQRALDSLRSRADV